MCIIFFIYYLHINCFVVLSKQFVMLLLLELQSVRTITSLCKLGKCNIAKEPHYFEDYMLNILNIKITLPIRSQKHQCQ